jgi:hypothetical protein
VFAPEGRVEVLKYGAAFALCSTPLTASAATFSSVQFRSSQFNLIPFSSSQVNSIKSSMQKQIGLASVVFFFFFFLQAIEFSFKGNRTHER